MTMLSAAAWVRAHGRARPEAPALASPELRLSYGDLAGALAAMAGDLSAAGFGPGQRLLVALPSGPAAAVAILAAQMAGGSAVPISREASAEAHASIAAQTGSRYAVVWAPDGPRWSAIQGRFEQLWVLPDPGAIRNVAIGLERVVRLGQDGAPLHPTAWQVEPCAVSPDDEALVLFTSGSTGEPRGVILTYRNVLANTRSIVEYLGLGPADRAMAVLPLFYCYGLSVLQTHLYAGGSLFFEQRSMYPRLVLQGIAEEGCTGLAGVPLTFELLRRHCGAPPAMPMLRYLTQAGGAMAPETAAWVRRAFHPAQLYVMYGQTEATARLAYLPPGRALEKAEAGSIGVPIPGVELRVVGPDGCELPAGEVGELVARGENIAAGYLDAPDETAAVFRADGLYTGDLARRDRDGFFFLVGRAKEMLKIGGHRVSPIQIEQVVLHHPAVLEAAVMGVPDTVQGETPAAFVVCREGQALTDRELRAFCRGHLPAHCVPSTVQFLAALPRSGSGKVLKQNLVHQALGAPSAGRG
jgi:acyl-CoA synthetase (AMP-forming)/AMP-acid ligase II